MNPKQFQQFLKSNDESTRKAVEIHVNGKIDNLTEMLKQHSIDDKVYQEKIDGNISWVIKLIIGAVILGVLSVIFKI